MAGRIAYYGNIATQGLVLNLDAAIQGSYPKTGSTWFDISNNGNNGTLINGPLYTGSDYGAIRFDGVNDYVLLNKQFMADALAGTFDIWFNLATTSGSSYFGIVSNILIGKPSSPDNSFGFSPNTSILRLRLGNGINLTSSVSVSTGSWQLGQGVWDSTGMSIYQNGSPVASVAVSGLRWFGGTTFDTVLGRNFVGSTNGSFTGQLGNVKVYNQSLSQFQVWQNFNAYKSRYGIPDIVTDGLVLNLDAGNPYSYLSGSSGTTWSNTVAASSSISGTLVNGPVYSNGAITFDGTNDYVSLPSTIPLNNVSQFSYSTFVKFNSSAGSSGNAFFSYGISNGFSNDILFAWDKASSKLFFQINSGSDGSGEYNYTPNNTWLNIGVVYNGSLATNSDKMKIYINGSIVSASFTYTVPSTTSTQVNPSCFIGGYTGYAPEWYFTGNMANTQIYNRALSATEITQNFNALRGRYGI